MAKASKAKASKTKAAKKHLSFQYDGTVRAIYKPMAKYAFFSLITLFIYRFWAKTNLRRYFWSSVRLNKQAFAYHGTGKELFFGALAVIGFFIIYYIVDYIASLVLVGDFVRSSVYSTIILLGFLFLFNFAIFRMLRYRLTRTSWRGVRFNLDGKAVRYGGLGLALTLADWLTLGLAYPWIRSRLMNYRLNRMRFGNQSFRSELRGRSLARWYYLMLAPRLIAFILLGVLATLITLEILPSINGAQDAEAISDRIVDFIQVSYGAILSIAILSMFVLYLLMRIFYRLFEAKTIISHLHFLDLRFACRTEIIKTGLLYALFRLGFTIGLSAVAAALYFALAQHILLAAVLVYPAYLYYYFFSVAFLNWVVSKFIKATAVSGDMSALEDVSAYRIGEPTRGEGWFELLDIGNL